MIVLSILGTAVIQFRKRIWNDFLRVMLELSALSIIVITVAGRLVSGVHWFTDILAGLLLGGAFIMLYSLVFRQIEYVDE